MPVLAAIVPPSFFAPQQTWTLWVVFLVSLAALAWAADRTVSSAVQLARRFGVSKVIVGATIVSLGTTTPEACVSVASALNGNAGIALGNAVGSIIFNTCLIFGSCCLVRSLPMDRFVMNRHGWLLVGAGMVLTLTCFGLWAAGGDIRAVVLPRQVGIVYLVLLTGYLFVSARWARQHPLEAIEGFEEASHGRELPAAAWTAILGLACGLAVIALSSDTLVGSVEVICRRMGVPEAVIAVTLVAFGTSLPELSTAVTALIKGHEDLTVGNIIGANILKYGSTRGGDRLAAAG